MNFVSFVFVSFFFPYWVFGKKWNGTDKNKQTNKQSILEAAHRDHEMVIEAFPIWGGGGTIFGIFGHFKTFISRNRNLLRSAQPIFFCLFFVKKKKKLTQTNRCLPNLLLPSKRTISRVSVIFDQRNMSLEIKLLKVQKKYSTFSYHEKISFFLVPTLND